jgi:hypothetical protein
MSLCNKKYYNFVIVGILESESKDVALEFLKKLMRVEKINGLSALHIFGENIPKS